MKDIATLYKQISPISFIWEILDMKNFTILIVALLVSACGTVPATMKVVGEDIFRGSASGSIGSNATIEMQNINGIICNGYIYIPAIDPNY